MSISAVVADFVLLNLTQKKKIFKRIKEHSIKEHHLKLRGKSIMQEGIQLNESPKNMLERKLKHFKAIKPKGFAQTLI
jgi:hypothetical protein